MDRKRLSCTTVTFGGKLPQKLQAMQAAGFAGTEFWPRDYYEHNEGPDIAIDLLRKHQLVPTVYQCLRNFEGMPEHLRSRKIAIARQLFDQMQQLGCETVTLCANIAPDCSGDRGRIVEDLKLLGDLAKSYGVRVAYEPICWGRWLSDYREAWQVIRKVDHPNIGILLDCFHIYALEQPIEPIADIDPAKVFLTEVADLPKVRMDFVEISRSMRLFPGEGYTPIREFIRQVERIGYQGWYSVEVFNSYALTLDLDLVAGRAMKSLERLFD
jgi:4-hydroxyphenylpyruvate dioxygenase